MSLKKAYNIVVILLFSLLFRLGNYINAQLPFTENFRNSTAPGMVFGGNPNPAILTSGNADPVGDGYLRITNNTNNQAGYAYNDDVVLPSVGLNISFEFFQYGGTGADGIVFFLFDATADPFQIGSYGGSLGYAQRSGGQNGVSKGFLGIGLDVFGNFSAPTEGRQGGPGRVTNSVTIRGAGNGSATVPTNYPFLVTQRTSSAPFSFNLGSGASRITDQTNAGYRKCYIRLKPRTGGGYFIDVDIETGGSPTTIHNVIVDYELIDNPPQELKFGFSAGTGGSTNFHEIRSMEVTAYDLASVPLPVALDDNIATCINETAEIDYLSNDYAQGPTLNFLNTSSIDLDPLTAGQQTTFTNVGEGTFTFNTTTEVLTFTPDIGYTGISSVDYTINDAYGQTSNVATITLNVVNSLGCVDLRVLKTVDIGNPENTDELVFTIEATNLGPNDGTNVVITDIIPDGYTYVSNNRGASYDGATQTITWNIGNLNNGDSETMLVNVTYNNPATEHLNTAVISGDEDDPNPNNDQSSVRPLNLSITKTADNMAPIVGTQVIFTLEAKNNSLTVDAPIVQVNDVLPAGYTYLSDNGGIKTTVTGNSILWNVGYMPANTTQTLEITAVVLASGPYLNTATIKDISGLVIDTNPADNVSSSEPIPTSRTPFSCNSTGYLFLGSPNTEVSTINYATGVTSAASALVGTTGLINALGYNTTDNFIWGYHNGNQKIVRIDSDFNVDEYEILGLPTNNYLAGDVSQTGVLHLYDPTTNYIVRVDVNPASPNYLKTQSNLTITNGSTPVTLSNVQDFSFNPLDGNLYSVFTASNSRRLLRINPTTGVRNDLGTMQAPSGVSPNGPYEASFIDVQGRSLFINQGNGQVWGIPNVSQGSLQGHNLFTSTTTAVGIADGAFCRTANFGMTWPTIVANDDDTGTRTVAGATNVLNILTNDTRGSYAATVPTVTISVVTPDPTSTISLNTSTGQVDIAPNSPAGTHTLTYRICETTVPGNCDTAVITVTIEDGITTTIIPTCLCRNDVPYIVYIVSANYAPAPANGTPMRIVFSNSTTRDSVTQVLTTFQNGVRDSILFAGASVDGDGNGNGWPGWVNEGDGWFEDLDQNFGELRAGALIQFKINPESEEFTIAYPATTPECAVEPTSFLLPVTWLSFNGRTERSSVHLSWSTASELNNDYFEVQRSSNGLNFEPIGYVQGMGTINTQTNYQFIDEKPLEGYNYYQLRQVDFDGTEDYSKIIVENVSGTTTNKLKVFPNPASSYLTLDNGLEPICNLIISDATGRQVFQKQIRENIVKISITNFENGLYLIRNQNGAVTKFTKQ